MCQNWAPAVAHVFVVRYAVLPGHGKRPQGGRPGAVREDVAVVMAWLAEMLGVHAREAARSGCGGPR